jgi:hypothetical protein
LEPEALPSELETLTLQHDATPTQLQPLRAIARSDTKSGLTTPFLVETRQMADGRWQKKEKTSGKKGVIKADLV